VDPAGVRRLRGTAAQVEAEDYHSMNGDVRATREMVQIERNQNWNLSMAGIEWRN
jgi:hypothetical protein